MAEPLRQGGFMLSPPASTISSSSTTASAAVLPHPRSSPLRSGGSKESTFIRFVDQRILHIQRRFAKRTTPVSDLLSDIDRDKADSWHDVKGYSSMRQACKDIEGLVGIIWLSGTPGLQVPYLINLALLLTSVISGMPPSPRSLFRLLEKLDLAFASLVEGRDANTGEALPGFTGRRGINETEKVRIRSLIEHTRVAVVEAFKRGDFEYDEPEAGESDAIPTDSEDALVLDQVEGEDITDDNSDDLNMQIAKVYDRTLVELGSHLEQPTVPMITE